MGLRGDLQPARAGDIRSGGNELPRGDLIGECIALGLNHDEDRIGGHDHDRRGQWGVT